MLARQPFVAVTVAEEPRIASAVVSGVRRTLIDLGQWPRVRARAIARMPKVRSWIDSALDGSWCPVAYHIVILESVAAEYGDDGIAAFGRARLLDNMSGGVLSPILRSWMRSYGGAPGHLLRVSPHVWRAVTRDLGRMVVVEMGERATRFRIEEMPEEARRCVAWHRFLEGYGVALLEAGSYPGAHVEISLGETPRQLEGSVRW
ncbi:hypothetical protein [Sandaracinus amylolyticus]|uniref:hypothetical protein n=1 Tax=Sandaracinus amylolyticus TaxID=927083 RepID=UPI00069FB335|nr:hypothetical protein [Sandaracinus amylolyticus]